MKSLVKNGFVAISVFYASSLALWFILHGWLGDTLWWLALLNAFAPYFFLPLVILLPICFVCRRRVFRAGIASSLCIFLLLYGPLYLPTWPASCAASEMPLTVMTFNIWGYSRSPETAQVLADGGLPDIVALQELAPAMVQVLAEELGHVYPYRSIDTASPGSDLGVFSRYPLTELDASHLSDAGGRVQILQVEVGDQKVTVYNVHLSSWNVLASLETGLCLATQVQTSIQLRTDLARRLADDVARRPGPVIVVGDFNSTPQSDVYATLVRVLSDAHHTAGWGLGPTYPAYGGRYRGIPIMPRQVRIDMIFHSQELVALHSSVGSTYGESDHLPVIARLAWRH
jgi:vancomycin resistance protein VanJ